MGNKTGFVRPGHKCYCISSLINHYRLRYVPFIITGMKKPSPITCKICDEASTLTLKCLDVSTLVNKDKKYRNRGGRNGTMIAMNQLEKDGLGTLKEKSS